MIKLLVAVAAEAAFTAGDTGLNERITLAAAWRSGGPVRFSPYEDDVAQSGEAKVCGRGQIALPAQTFHRWGLDQGGTNGWLDPGDSVLLVPGGLSRLRDEAIAGADPGRRPHRVRRPGTGEP